MIVHLFNSSVVSGPETLTIPALKRLGEEVAIVFLRERRLGDKALDPERYAGDQGHSVWHVEVDSRFDRGAVRSLRALLETLGPSIVHAHDVKASIYLWAATPRNAPWKLVSTHHGAAARPGILRAYEELYVRAALTRFDLALAVCTWDYRSIERRGIRPDRLRLHLNGADGRLVTAEARDGERRRNRAFWLQRYPELPRDLQDRVVFGAVGRLATEKRHDRMIRILADLKRRRDEDAAPILLCWGTGPLESALREQVRKLGLEQEVFFLGYSQSAAAEMSGLDLLLCLSDGEGIPVNLIEAGWAGTPVLSTRVGGIEDLIPEPRYGLTVSKEEADENIAAVIAAALASPSDLRNRAMAYQKRITESFSESAWLETLRDAYARLRAQSATRRHQPVMLVTQYLGFGGLERMVYNLSSELRRNPELGYAPWVYAYDEIPGLPTLEPLMRARGIPVVTVLKSRGFSLKALYRLVATAVRNRVRLLHSHDLGALIYAVAARIATLGWIRVVHTQHSFIHLEKSPRYKDYERFFTRFTSHVTTVSEGLRQQYSEVRIDPSTVEVLPNGVVFPESVPLNAGERDLARAELLKNLSEPAAAERLQGLRDKVWLISLARIHPRKGQDHVIEVWNELTPEQREKCALVFIGQETSPGALERLRGWIAKAQDSHRVVYAGFSDAPAPWLKAGDIAITGSEFEGMPLGPIEALGSGLRVLASDIPGHAMLPGDERQVGRFPLANPASGAAILGRWIEELAISGAPAAVVTPAGLRTRLWDESSSIRREFGTAKMAERYAGIYSSVSS